MTTRWCAPCSVWWYGDEPCWACDRPGDDTRTDWQIAPARSWRNQAEWRAGYNDADEGEL